MPAVIIENVHKSFGQNEVLNVMGNLAREGMTMLLVTHEMNFARNVADVTVFMHQGKIWEQGAGACAPRFVPGSISSGLRRCSWR